MKTKFLSFGILISICIFTKVVSATTYYAKVFFVSSDETVSVATGDNANNVLRTTSFGPKVPSGNEDNIVVIKFYSDPNLTTEVSVNAVNIKEVDLVVNKKVVSTFSDFSQNSNLYQVDLTSIAGSSNGDLIIISIKLNNAADNLGNSSSFYFNYYTSISNYGIANGAPLGFWLPTGMFATNFNRSNVGVTFAPEPIGAAWGKKINDRNDNGYIGISLCAKWLIYQQNNSNNSITFSSAALGVLFDISNYITVGADYGVDLTTNKQNPGLMFVVGIGPGLLNFIKSSSKP